MTGGVARAGGTDAGGCGGALLEGDLDGPSPLVIEAGEPAPAGVAAASDERGSDR